MGEASAASAAKTAAGDTAERLQLQRMESLVRRTSEWATRVASNLAAEAAAVASEYVPGDPASRRTGRMRDRLRLHQTAGRDAAVFGRQAVVEMIDVLDGTPVILAVKGGRDGAGVVHPASPDVDEPVRMMGVVRDAGGNAFVYCRRLRTEGDPLPAFLPVRSYESLMWPRVGVPASGRTPSSAVHQRLGYDKSGSDAFGTRLRRARRRLRLSLLDAAETVSGSVSYPASDILDLLAAWENGVGDAPHPQSVVASALRSLLDDDLFGRPDGCGQSAKNFSYEVCAEIERSVRGKAVAALYADTPLWRHGVAVPAPDPSRGPADAASPASAGDGVQAACGAWLEKETRRRHPHAARVAVWVTPPGAIVTPSPAAEDGLVSDPASPGEVAFSGYVSDFTPTAATAAEVRGALGVPDDSDQGEAFDPQTVAAVWHKLGLRRRPSRVLPVRASRPWDMPRESCPYDDLAKLLAAFRACEGVSVLPGSRRSDETPAGELVYVAGRSTLRLMLRSSHVFETSLHQVRETLREAGMPTLVVSDEGVLDGGVVRPHLPDGVVMLYRVGGDAAGWLTTVQPSPA